MPRWRRSAKRCDALARSPRCLPLACSADRPNAHAPHQNHARIAEADEPGVRHPPRQHGVRRRDRRLAPQPGEKAPPGPLGRHRAPPRSPPLAPHPSHAHATAQGKTSMRMPVKLPELGKGPFANARQVRTSPSSSCVATCPPSQSGPSWSRHAQNTRFRPALRAAGPGGRPAAAPRPGGRRGGRRGRLAGQALEQGGPRRHKQQPQGQHRQEQHVRPAVARALRQDGRAAAGHPTCFLRATRQPAPRPRAGGGWAPTPRSGAACA